MEIMGDAKSTMLISVSRLPSPVSRPASPTIKS